MPNWTELIGVEGFVRVGKDERGMWWFVDPQGGALFLKASAGVNRAGTTGGRLAKPGPYADAVDRIYDYPASPQRFVDAEQQRLREWGFNAHGSWVTEEFFDQGMYYTDIIEARHQSKADTQITMPGMNLSDIFDPRFEAGVKRICAELCPPRRASKEFVGYFTDNELGWGQPSTDRVWGGDDYANAVGSPTLLQNALSLEEDRPLRREALRWVNEHHGSLENALRAWGCPVGSLAELRAATLEGLVLNSATYGHDHHAFSVFFALEYFRITGEAIRAQDPNHLLMGCRFGAPPGLAIAEAVRLSPYVDVVSANNYRDTQGARMDEYFTPMQKPLLIGEYSWASDYHSLPGRDPGWLGDERLPREVRTEIKGRAALEAAFVHPGVAGYTWYRWVQDPDPEAPWRSYGLVDRSDQPHPFNTRLLSELNPKAEALRRGELQPVTCEEQRFRAVPYLD